MLKDALKTRDFSEDALILAKAATLVRKDILSHQGFKFTGCFPAQCQEDSISSSLKSLVSMILNVSNLKDQDKRDSQACLTIGQSIIYNTKGKTSRTAVKTRHTLEREPPLPIYIGINMHALSRSKTLIQQLYQMGISVSYDRYSPSLLPSQTLASFIYQTRNLACCNVLSSPGNQSHPQLTTAKSWMVPSSSTSYQLPASAPSMSMQTLYSYRTWRSRCRLPRGWMLCGTHTYQTV